MWFDLRGRNPNIQPNAMNTEDVNDPEVKDVQDDTQAPEANAEQAAEAAAEGPGSRRRRTGRGHRLAGQVPASVRRVRQLSEAHDA